MAGAHVYAGDCAAGEARGDAALRLNAYDPDITGFMGLFKPACVHGAAALPLLQRSLDLDASYAGVPAVPLAFMLAQNGEVDRADRKSTRLNSSHECATRMPSSACKTKKEPAQRTKDPLSNT